MEQTQYLEITSERRNRNEYPLPSQFEVPLSQSGHKLAINSVDPVSLAAAETRWKTLSFNAKQEVTTTLTSSDKIYINVQVSDIENIASPTLAETGNTSATFILIVNTLDSPSTSGPGSLHTIKNYYRGAVASILGNNGNSSKSTLNRRRIIEYEFLGNDTAKLVFDAEFGSAITKGTTILTIIDPTTLSLGDYTSPYIFVPASPNISNAYTNYKLYNETKNQTRRIKSFDPVTHLLSVDTSKSNLATATEGPVTNWEFDVLSIRRIDPTISIELSGDINNNATTFRSFNLSIADSNNISNKSKLSGSFLEVKRDIATAQTLFQAGGNKTTTVQLSAVTNFPEGYLNGGIIRVLSGPAEGQFSTITSYDGTNTRIATLEPGFTQSIAEDNNYDIILPQEAKRIVKYVDYRDSAIGGSTTSVNFPITNSSRDKHPFYQNGYYNDLFIKVGSDIRKITNYNVIRNSDGVVISAIATIDPTESAFSVPVAAGTAFTITSGLIEGGSGQFTYSLSNQDAYILPYTYDNLFPFINASGHSVNAHQWYELELLNLILPNQILDSGFGGTLSCYQYIYVEFENTNGSGISGNNNILSNNSNAVGMTFRATIDDVPNPVNSKFIKIDGDGMTQIVRFDPQNNIKLSVYLSTGSNPHERELLKFLPEENFSPNPPNPLIQISAMFSIKKVVLKSDVLAQNARY